MRRKKSAVEFNKYLIPILLGVIVFLNTTFLESLGNNINQITMYGVNGLTAILFICTLLLFYTIAPKAHIWLCFINRFRSKNPVKLKEWIKKSNKVDYSISVIIWYSLFTILVCSSINALFVVF